METRKYSPWVPPAIPQRTSSQRVWNQNIVRMTREQYDLWEHAASLHHGFEWQAAAQSFLYLSHFIKVELESNLCLLNAALMFIRLEDYALASETVESAGQVEELLPFTLYLMGHIELELPDRNIGKARDCFSTALQRLDIVGGSQSFQRLGLDFSLRTSLLRNTLEMLDRNDHDLVTLKLGAIAANCIFEAPTRPTGNMSMSVNTSTTMSCIHLVHASPGYSSDGSSTTAGSGLEKAVKRTHWWRPSSPQARPVKSERTFRLFKRGFTNDHPASPTDAGASIKKPRRRVSKSSIRVELPPTGFSASIQEPPFYSRPLSQASFARVEKDLPSTPRNRLEARDPRCRDGSTADSVHFIMGLPVYSPLEHRDAEMQLDPMREDGDVPHDPVPLEPTVPPPLSIRKVTKTDYPTPSPSEKSVCPDVPELPAAESESQPSCDLAALTPPPKSKLRICASAVPLGRISPPTAIHPALRPGFTL